MSTHAPRAVVIIPTYNERESLPRTLSRVRTAQPHLDVVVVDDSSPDGTGQWAEEEASNDSAVHVLHRSGKEGLGPAYLAGFAWAIAEGYEVLIQMDADGSHRPEQLHRLLTALSDNVDAVFGSRWVPGGRVHDWPLHRLVLSKGGSLYTRMLLGLGVRDCTAGYRAYRAELIARLTTSAVASQGYCFQVDMTRRAHACGATIVEVPIDFDERIDDASKMTLGIVAEALVRVTTWGIQRRTRQLCTMMNNRAARTERSTP